MVKLTADEHDLLERIHEKEELRPFFFRKAKGLKWFDPLAERGYFLPDQNPKPIPAKEKGYINVPFWPASEYLVTSSAELLEAKNKAYAEKYIEIIRSVTKHAINNKYSNYRTWWQFSKVIQNIPPILIQQDDIQLIDYWLDDLYERSLLAGEIGEKWIPALLERQDEHCKRLASALLETVYKLEFHKSENKARSRKEVALRFRSWYAKRITDKVASKAGKVIGADAVRLFQSRLEAIISEFNNDRSSPIWRRAIEEHPQNHQSDDVDDILVEGFRDALLALVESKPEDGKTYITEMLRGKFETVKRIAIHVVDRQYQYLSSFADDVTDYRYFTSIFRHELWHLLHNHYRQFSEYQKRRVWDAISGLVEIDENNQVRAGASAYKRAVWLAAIRDYGDDVNEFYKESVDVAGAEPEHPDFSSYMTSGWVNHKSPFSKEELLSWDADELIKQLNEYLESYKQPRGFDEPSLEGLVKMLRQVVKSEPLRFSNQLHRYSRMALPYVYEFIEAYSELWTEKAQLPWEEILGYLLSFCEDIIKQERFWNLEDEQRNGAFVANKHWIVGGVGRLIENGTRSDEHAFPEKYLAQAESILLIILEKQEGDQFKLDSDAVSVAINSPRGRCIEAFINLTLRSCRLADKQHGNHIATWAYFQPTYDTELERTDNGGYEFATLIVNFLPNFLYMSKDWIFGNLNNIFNQKNYQKWLCAMQGYAYVSLVYEEIYKYLKENGHLIRALDDDNVKKRVDEKIVQNIAVAYINDFESLEDESSLIHQLLIRRKYEELSQLIWFIWTLRKDGDQKIREKVFELWPRLIEVIDTSTQEGRRLASKLCDWFVFVDEVNEGNKKLMLAIAPFAEEEYNSHDLLESIAKISEKQPFEAYEIWLKLLEKATPDFPEEAIRAALTNLIRVGPEGVRNAKTIVSEYIKGGNEQPALWLREITGEVQHA